MNGPEHYQEAERLLTQAAPPRRGYARGNEPDQHPDPLAAAQVHATLALAAATMDVARATSNSVVSAGWSEALA